MSKRVKNGGLKKAALSSTAAAIVAVVGMGASTSVQAGPIFLGLGLDASDSISDSQFEQQRDGYINVLESLESDLIDNEVWIAMNQFASSASSELIPTEVTAGGASILPAFANMEKLGGGTNIDSSIDDLVSQYESMPEGFFESAVIDISTDGQDTLGSSVQDALNAGINNINCLGVGADADCTFIDGDDPFSITIDSFEDFETALNQKIETEVGIEVPTPATAALFAAGLVGFGFARRRRRENA